MKIELRPDDIEMTLRIDGGEFTLIDEESCITFEIILTETDMEYLKRRLNEWTPG